MNPIELSNVIGVQACEILKTRGCNADWEYPGYIAVPLENGHQLIAGHDDGYWQTYCMMENGANVSFDATTLDHKVYAQWCDLSKRCREEVQPSELAELLFATREDVNRRGL
jgi:hypothetical protein